MQIKKIISFLETIAPPVYQESYDNSGLLVGNPTTKVTGVMICLDSTEEVLKDAKRNKCNLVIAHHPIIFKGLKRLNGNSYIERVVIYAIKHDIAIYAIHTNLDNMLYKGVNTKIAEVLGLKNTKILAPKKDIKKLQTYVPSSYSGVLRTALFKAGAGQAKDAKRVSYSSLGVSTNNGSQGLAEIKLEVLYPAARQGAILNALKSHHPADDVVYETFEIDNSNDMVGAGIVGDLNRSLEEKSFLKTVKKKMQTDCIRHTALLYKKVKRVAICGGAGGFLLKNAIREEADAFITADYKYHEFFDADGKILIADIGHYESEQYTIDLLYDIISNNFSNFAVYCTAENTNPVHYLT